MNPLVELSHQVLLGTDRRAPQGPALPEALETLVGAVSGPEATVETRTLRMAAALAVCADAGYEPTVAAPVHEVCPPETAPVLGSPDGVRVLRRVLADGPPLLQREAFERIARSGAVLPPGLLPDALELGRRTASLRPLLVPILGVRGQWLAALNGAWAQVSAGTPEAFDPLAWERATLDTRVTLLSRLRAQDPAHARALLDASLGACDARERAALLATCVHGLSLADEAFLSARLSDRSREVRSGAADLLARLDGSAFVARMTARLEPLLVHTRKLLSSTWVIEAPSAFGEDWRADGLEAKRVRQDGLGERAWWLYQLARHVPLAWWRTRTGMSAVELLKWARGTDWEEALTRAWQDAFARAPTPEWARAFMDHPPRQGLQLEPATLTACLPQAEREALWLAQWTSSSRAVQRGAMLAEMVRSLGGRGEQASPAFAGRMLDHLRACIPLEASKWDSMLRQSVPEFICLLPPDALDGAAHGWPVGQPGTDYFSDTLARVLAVIEHRKILHDNVE